MRLDHVEPDEIVYVGRNKFQVLTDQKDNCGIRMIGCMWIKECKYDAGTVWFEHTTEVEKFPT